MTNTTHTYTIDRQPADDWFPAESFSVKCSCGIASGMVHASIADAHREPPHTLHIGDRRPTGVAAFSGIIRG